MKGKIVGDIADYVNEQGEDLWFDHLAGHPNFPDICPYCEDEYESEKKSEEKENGESPTTENQN